jgi:enoyl-CoA hydratase/carnithine racemase
MDFKNIGLVNEVLPKEGFLEKVIQVAKDLSRKNQDVLRFTKACLNTVCYANSFEEASRIEEMSFQSTFQKDKDAWMETLRKRYPLL